MTYKHPHPRFWRCAMAMLLSLLCSVTTAAGATDKHDKTLLIINSYDEYEPWGNDIVTTITMYLARVDDVDCDIVNLDNALIVDDAIYNKVEDNVFGRYSERHPDYVVMIGSLAFNLRERIKKEWGDVPTLLISRTPLYGNKEDYFTGALSNDNRSAGTPISMLRKDYNFTAIIMPDHHRETIDLMVRLIPDMEEFVFFATTIYVTRSTSKGIENYLRDNYPGIKFRWVQSSPENSAIFREYISNHKPKTGILIASWVYEKEGIRGYQTLTGNDLRMIANSHNPIFALREAYMSMGCIGGVFIDNDKMKDKIIDVVKKMINGQSMRNVPFIRAEDKVTKMNHRLLTSYGLNENLCPEDTVFVIKPESFFDKYKWQMLAVMLFLLVLAVSFWFRMWVQHKKIQSLNYNRLFLSNMPVPFAKADIRFDKQGNVKNIEYTAKNHAFEELIQRNAILGNPFLLFPADFISEKTQELLRTKKNVKFLYHFEQTDTDYEFILCSVKMKSKVDYETLSIVDIFAIDITERFKMEDKLGYLSHKLDIALEATHIVPWHWNLETDIITFDDKSTLGRTTSHPVVNHGVGEWEIPYGDWVKRLHPEDQPIAASRREMYMNGMRNDMAQLRMYLDPNSDKLSWMELYSTVSEFDKDGKPRAVTGSFRNITELKKSEQAIRDALEKAEESDRMKSAFLANMSHEIRTPLNAIVGFSNLIADSVDNPDMFRFRDIINQNNELLLSLINDVLDLAKIESNTIQLNIGNTDVNNVVNTAVQTVQLRLQKGVQLKTVIGLRQCVIRCDTIRLTQILINFLTNACKFTMQGTITCGYELRNGSDLYFYVKDTGIGLSEEGRQKVFGRFVKLNNFAQGTGLGLAISKRLVELMGGNIGVESEGEGKGSCFWFTLPNVVHVHVQRGKGPAQPADEPMSLEAIGKRFQIGMGVKVDADGEFCENIIQEQPLLLVAEDNDSNFMLLEQLLKDDYVLSRAHNGAEAVEMFKAETPDAILMDIQMPVMDGFEATAEIRKISTEIPIIAVTAYAYASERKRILSSGFVAYLSKPINHNEIREVLAKALGR